MKGIYPRGKRDTQRPVWRGRQGKWRSKKLRTGGARPRETFKTTIEGLGFLLSSTGKMP